MRIFSGARTVAGLGTSRIEAFSDGVFAIAITLLVLNLHVPTSSKHPSRTRTFLAADGSYLFDDHLEHLIRREIHTILFPNIDYMYDDYCLRLGCEPIRLNGFPNLTAAHQAASEEQRRIAKKWNNAKCDALSLHALSNRPGCDDVCFS